MNDFKPRRRSSENAAGVRESGLEGSAFIAKKRSVRNRVRISPPPTNEAHLCLLSNHGHGTVVMKNCEPFVFGPALAIDNVYGRSCFRDG